MTRLDASVIRQVQEKILDGFGLDWTKFRSDVKWVHDFPRRYATVTFTHKESHKTIDVDEVEVDNGVVIAAKRGATMLT